MESTQNKLKNLRVELDTLRGVKEQQRIGFIAQQKQFVAQQNALEKQIVGVDGQIRVLIIENPDLEPPVVPVPVPSPTSSSSSEGRELQRKSSSESLFDSIPRAGCECPCHECFCCVVLTKEEEAKLNKEKETDEPSTSSEPVVKKMKLDA